MLSLLAFSPLVGQTVTHNNLTIRSSLSLEMYWASACTKRNLESWYTGFEQFLTYPSVLDEPDGAYFERFVMVKSFSVKIGRESLLYCW